MRKLIFGIMLVFFALAVIVGFLGYKRAKQQGLSDSELALYTNASIRRDERGVLHIRGKSWLDVIEAQGFAAASERMFQFDLMRRKGDGALAELFGKSALDYDRQQRKEDWRHYANLAADALPGGQRSTCDAYARGVNRFLQTYPARSGIEYSLLRVSPEPWSCVDTLLIVMAMSDNMSRSWTRDLDMKQWRDVVPGEWWDFIFPLRHPWNKPWFEPETAVTAASVVPSQALPKTQLTHSDFKIEPELDHRGLDGSNSWAYRGKNGAWLANDPHLGYQVPQLWVPFRLETDDGWWIVGTALPGVPGILIGMNKDLAWSITNTGEDVDDAVIENSAGDFIRDSRVIKIKGEKPESLEVRRSPKGPVVRDLPGTKVVVRQWIALKPGVLNLPVESLNHATNWDSFNGALDDFRFVPLSFTMLDRLQNMGLRISGCDLKRQNNGGFAEYSDISNWDPSCGISQRRRLYIPANNGADSAFISTNNERLWMDDRLHNWSDDDRASRIREVLASSPSLTGEDMRLLQLDTTSRFHKELILWLLKHGSTSFLTTQQRADWEAWDGNIRTCPLCMSEASDAATLLDQMILRTVARNFNRTGTDFPYVKRQMERARVVMFMELPDIPAKLGFDDQEIATGIIKSVARVPVRRTNPWPERNHWAVQHPFVGRLPLIGSFFSVPAPAQFGAPSVLRAEKPTHGPSTRIIWEPSNPASSSWSFPTGVSGHALSNHYSDWSNLWQQGGAVAIPAAI